MRRGARRELFCLSAVEVGSGVVLVWWEKGRELR